jgi:hypothetical protein
VIDGGRKILWNDFIEDDKFAEYRILDEKSKIIPNDIDKIQYYFVKQIHLAINNQLTTLCTGLQALETQKVLEDIEKKI